MTRPGPIQSMSLRSLPPLTWAMVLIGLIYLLTSLSAGNRSVPALAFGIAPLLFAAAVTFVRPIDQRYVYGAVLIGVGRGMAVLAAYIASGRVVSGDLAEQAYAVVAFLQFPVTLVGIALIGMATARVRTRFGYGVVGAGIAVALLALAWYIPRAPSADALPLQDVVTGAVFAALHPIVWAYVVAAAWEARRRALLLGALLLFVALIAGALLVPLGPSTNLVDVSLIVQAIGWLLLAAAPFRGEIRSSQGSHSTGR